MSSSSPRENVVFVGGISRKVDEACLRNFFSTFGTVTECKIIVDHLTGKSKGYGFVVFADRQAADTVKKAPQEDLFLLGKSMNVGDAYRKSDAATQQGQDAGAFGVPGAVPGMAGRPPQQRRYMGPGGAGSPVFYESQQQQYFTYAPPPYYASAGFYPQYYAPGPGGWQGYQFPYAGAAQPTDAAAAQQGGAAPGGTQPAPPGAVGGEDVAAGFARMQLGPRSAPQQGSAPGMPAGGAPGSYARGGGMAPYMYAPQQPQPQQQPQQLPQATLGQYVAGARPAAGGRVGGGAMRYGGQTVSPTQALPAQGTATASVTGDTTTDAPAAAVGVETGLQQS